MLTSSRYPGVWRQGDWIKFTERGSCVITGRSDATLNRGGVRLGTGEFYAVVEDLPEIVDSLVVHLEDDGGGSGELLLFVVPAPGATFDDELRGRIAGVLRSELSPRHVPDAIVAVPAIPRTLTAKKLELPVKQILRGYAARRTSPAATPSLSPTRSTRSSPTQPRARSRRSSRGGRPPAPPCPRCAGSFPARPPHGDPQARCARAAAARAGLRAAPRGSAPPAAGSHSRVSSSSGPGRSTIRR